MARRGYLGRRSIACWRIFLSYCSRLFLRSAACLILSSLVHRVSIDLRRVANVGVLEQVLDAEDNLV
jgi:hypothetical protein